MTKNISKDITLTLTRENSIRAYAYLEKCAQRLEEAMTECHEAYESYTNGDDRYDFNDFLDCQDVEFVAHCEYEQAFEHFCAC